MLKANIKFQTQLSSAKDCPLPIPKDNGGAPTPESTSISGRSNDGRTVKKMSATGSPFLTPPALNRSQSATYLTASSLTPCTLELSRSETFDSSEDSVDFENTSQRDDTDLSAPTSHSREPVANKVAAQQSGKPHHNNRAEESVTDISIIRNLGSAFDAVRISASASPEANALPSGGEENEEAQELEIASRINAATPASNECASTTAPESEQTAPGKDTAQTTHPIQAQPHINLSDLFKKLRGHYADLPQALINMYKGLNESAAKILAENQYNKHKIILVQRTDTKHANGKPKAEYKLSCSDEFRNAISPQKPEDNEIYTSLSAEIKKQERAAKKALGTTNTNVRVPPKGIVNAIKNAGLDEIFQTAESMEYFYRSAGLIEHKAPFSKTKNGEKITWLDCQRDVRIPTYQVLFNNGHSHSGALSPILDDGKLKGSSLTVGQNDFHNQRNDEIKRSKTPLSAIVRALRYMRHGERGMINTEAFLRGEVYLNQPMPKKENKKQNINNAETPSKVNAIYNIYGSNLCVEGERIPYASTDILGPRNLTREIHREAFNQQVPDNEFNDALSDISRTTLDSVLPTKYGKQ